MVKESRSMKMHHPSHAMADRVSVRTYLLAGVSVLSAGMIAASPAGPPQADHTVALTPLDANSLRLKWGSRVCSPIAHE